MDVGGALPSKRRGDFRQARDRASSPGRSPRVRPVRAPGASAPMRRSCELVPLNNSSSRNSVGGRRAARSTISRRRLDFGVEARAMIGQQNRWRAWKRRCAAAKCAALAQVTGAPAQARTAFKPDGAQQRALAGHVGPADDPQARGAAETQRRCPRPVRAGSADVRARPLQRRGSAPSSNSGKDASADAHRRSRPASTALRIRRWRRSMRRCGAEARRHASIAMANCGIHSSGSAIRPKN